MPQENLIKRIVKIYKKYWYVPGIFAIGIAILGYYYAVKQPAVYQSKATLFVVDAQYSGAQTPNLTALISGTTNFGGEGNIYILDVAQSRVVREKVVMTVLPEFGMKTIGELLLESQNKAFPSDAQPIPADKYLLINQASNIIYNNLSIEMTKMGLIEFKYSTFDEKILTPVSNVIINNIIDFYKELKISKAEYDFQFAERKLDSINRIIAQVDNKAVYISNNTRFVPEEKIEYIIPRENLITDKSRLVMLKQLSANNREEALWRLQRTRPVVKILDAPNPPFISSKPSAIIFALVGFLIGSIIGLIVIYGKLIKNLISDAIDSAINGSDEEHIPLVTTTAGNDEIITTTTTTS